MKWISVADALPDNGATVRAYGVWFGEVSGRGAITTAEVTYSRGNWFMDSDTYSTELVDVTHWHELLDPPELC